MGSTKRHLAGDHGIRRSVHGIPEPNTAALLVQEFDLPGTPRKRVDISEKALSMAKKNARQHKADHIQFILSSWFKNIPKNRFDLIISNPPYISPNDQHLREGDVRFEPNSALIAQDNGLDDFKKIITKASVFLNPKGTILLEHGFQQGAIVKNLLESSGFVQIRHYQDIQGHVRATLGKKP